MGDPEDPEQVSEESATDPEESAPAPVDGVLPFTSQEFVETLDKLIERGKAAGVRPFQVMASAYVRQAMSLVDGILGALEGDDKKKNEGGVKKKGKKA